ncbi:hypothetical protein [Vreelandella titanicae]|uniref:hypothetical protein n=1 Tax=Vreelandella titanicae TaxID=664683 RepID=UPI00167FFAF0|nr:hypothetical protein [Halomonas titanicae]QNU62786.1 hypothetical protein HZS52_24195 [Halomonas titanicae]
MANVALSTEEFKKALLFVSLTTIAIVGLVGSVRHVGFGDNGIHALMLGLGSGVSWAIAVSIWAFRRPWTTKWLARWTGRPIIHGVWFGHLRTNYGANNDRDSKAIPIAFVIKQTYLGYSLLSYTEHQDSQTLIESLSVDDRHNTIHLRYIYEFYIRKPDERKLTTGAAELKLIEDGERLFGHYLTNSPTQGFADLILVQRECRGIDTFGAVQKLYQEKFPT